LRLDFYRTRSIKYLLKIRGIRRRLNFIQLFETPIEFKSFFVFSITLEVVDFCTCRKLSVQKHLLNEVIFSLPLAIRVDKVVYKKDQSANAYFNIL
jgi:hypothetical protein